MKKIVLIIISILTVSCSNNQPSAMDINSDKKSYAMGLQIGNTVKRKSPVNQEILIEGIRDALKDSPKISQQEVRKILIEAQNQLMKKTIEEYSRNNELGKKVLSENSKNPGVKTLSSGVQMLTIKEGSGKPITSSSVVRIQYLGSLIDGSIFDSSEKNKMPIKTVVSRAFPGWRDALVEMKAKGRYKLWVPADKGYGKSSRPGIPPGSLLIYTIDILDAN